MTADLDEGGGEAAAVTVYWRPGCFFCGPLLRWFDDAGVATVRHNIWEDPAAAADLRVLTGGPETVPTVVVGDVALINPAIHDVLEVLREHQPEMEPADAGKRPRRWWERILP